MSSVLPGFEYDIFISYRHNDNRSGWVTDFVNALQEELAATIKEPLSIYFDKNPHDGLLETHDVDDSLQEKLKCLIFIPIISQTYCDSKSFAWKNEFLVFKNQASKDQLGLKLKLTNGNVANRILPVRIHDLDADDKALLENELGPLRGIDFIYKSAGVNRPLAAIDRKEENTSKIYYRDQINKTANAVKELITATKNPSAKHAPATNSQQPAIKPIRSKQPIFIALAALFIATASFFIYRYGFTDNNQPTQNKSIAVLPFDDLSPNHDQEYFGIGMMDEILNHLTKIGDLSPVSRTSSLVYGKSKKTTKEIAGELAVANILEGSISKSGNSFKITARLIDAESDRHLWSENYIVDATDIFAIQSEVAQKVATALSARTSTEVKKRMDAIPTKNQEAYELYLKAHAKLFGAEDVKPLLERVIELDPNFSQAYSDLAFRWLLKGYWAGDEDPAVVKNKIRALLKKSTQLDPNNIDAYWGMVNIHLFFEHNLDSAYLTLEKAVQLNPSRSDLGQAFQIALCANGKFKEALNKSLFYFERDRNLPQNWIGLGNSYFYNGQPDKAIETLQAATKFIKEKLYTEDEVLTELAQMKLFTGDYKGVLEIFEPLLNKGYPLYYGYAGIAYAKLGQLEKVSKMLEQLKLKQQVSSAGSPFYFAAAVYTALGEFDQAFQFLDKACTNHEVEIFWLKVIPIFEPLRKDPRFQLILKKAGFK